MDYVCLSVVSGFSCYRIPGRLGYPPCWLVEMFCCMWLTPFSLDFSYLSCSFIWKNFHVSSFSLTVYVGVCTLDKTVTSLILYGLASYKRRPSPISLPKILGLSVFCACPVCSLFFLVALGV